MCILIPSNIFDLLIYISDNYHKFNFPTSNFNLVILNITIFLLHIFELFIKF